MRSETIREKILVVLDRQVYVDKSVLAAGSKVFRSYFQENQLDSIEIVDVTLNDMIEFLQFLYPQFPCTINNENITSLLILGKDLSTGHPPIHSSVPSAHRFEFDLLSSACRTFIHLYVSQLKSLDGNLIEQKDGTRISTEILIEILSIWYREFLFDDDHSTTELILQTLSHHHLSSKNLDEFEEKIQYRIFRARVKYLEHQLSNSCIDQS